MKTKIISMIALAILMVACATKTPAPAAVVKSQNPKTETKTAVLVAVMDSTKKTVKMEEGKSLYEGSCVRCHKLFSPKEYNKESWSIILPRMQRKANLDDNVIAAISNYIYSEI